MCNNNNLSCRSRIPGTLGMKLPVNIVNNYQSLTIVTKTHNPGLTWSVYPPLDLILIIKV